MDIKELLIKHEGLRKKPYKDTVGKLTIGVGRNLDDVGLSLEECHYLLDNDIKSVENSLIIQLPWYKSLDPVRKDILKNMCFNLGINGLLGFSVTLKEIEKGHYQTAAQHMLDSKWASQVKGRAKELADMMITGKYSS